MTVNFMENYRKRNIVLEGSHDNVFKPDSIIFKESIDNSMSVQYICGVCAAMATEFQDIVIEYYQEGVVDGVINFIKKVIEFIIKLLKGLISLLLRIFNKIWSIIKGAISAILNIFRGGNSSGGGGGGGGSVPSTNKNKKPPRPPVNPPAGSVGIMKKKVKKLIEDYATDPWQKGLAVEIRKNSKKADEMMVELGNHIGENLFKNMSNPEIAELTSVVSHAGGKMSLFGYLMVLSDEKDKTNSLISTLSLMCSNMKTFKETLDKVPSFVDSNGALDVNMKHIHDNLKITMDKEEIDTMRKLYSKIDEAVMEDGRVNNTFTFNNEAIVHADLEKVVDAFLNAVNESVSTGQNMDKVYMENKKTLNRVTGMCSDMVKVAEDVKKILEEKGIDKVREYTASGAKPSKEALTVSSAIKDRVVVFMNEIKIVLGLASNVAANDGKFADLCSEKIQELMSYSFTTEMVEMYSKILTPEELSVVKKDLGVQ